MNQMIKKEIEEFGSKLYFETSSELNERYIKIVELLSKNTEYNHLVKLAFEVFKTKDFILMFDFLEEEVLNKMKKW